jgi:hypothetical protein
MLIAIEGASAAGKTTWCRRFARGRVLFEGEPSAPPEPPGASDPDPADACEASRYWIDVNARRWTEARERSERLGWTICDTDPFKLHLAWTLWTEGLASSAYWKASREFSRLAFANSTLGLADLILFADLDAETLRHQKANDPTRTRSRHEMHIRIAPALRRWYSAMAAIDPNRVQFRLPTDGLQAEHCALGPRSVRTGTALFDRHMGELDRY